MPPGGGNGIPPDMPGMGGPLPLGEPAGGKGGKGGMPRPPGGGMKPGGGPPGPPGPGMKGGGGMPAAEDVRIFTSLCVSKLNKSRSA